MADHFITILRWVCEENQLHWAGCSLVCREFHKTTFMHNSDKALRPFYEQHRLDFDRYSRNRFARTRKEIINKEFVLFMKCLEQTINLTWQPANLCSSWRLLFPCSPHALSLIFFPSMGKAKWTNLLSKGLIFWVSFPINALKHKGARFHYRMASNVAESIRETIIVEKSRCTGNQ